MKTILLSIMLHNDKNFINEFKLLKDTYNKIILKHNLPIKVVGYMESDNGNNYIDIYNEIIYVACGKNNLTDKFILFGINSKYFFEDFDYYIKTNTSTIVNLQLLNHIVQENLLDDNTIYGIEKLTFFSDNYRDDSNIFSYLRGNFILMSNSIYEKIIYNKEYYNVIDDVFIGYCTQDNPIITLKGIQVFNKLNGIDFYSGSWLKDITCDEFKNLIAIQFKDNKKDRDFFEEYSFCKLLSFFYLCNDIDYSYITNLNYITCDTDTINFGNAFLK